MAGILPLQLPDPIKATPVDWSPLGEIGNAFAKNRRDKAMSEAVQEATVNGRLDPSLAVASLMKRGYGAEAGTLLNFLGHQGTLDLAERKFQYEQKQDSETRQNQRRAIDALGGVGPQSSVDSGVAPVSMDIPQEGRALLSAISGSESNYPGRDPYKVIYGGREASNLADHPRQYVPIVSGPNRGNVTSAAGRYQYLGSSWDEAKKALGLPDFSPDSQDKAAWWDAQRTYKTNTGRDLLEDIKLAGNDPQKLSAIGRGISTWWTSLPGGIEPNRATGSFGTRFSSNLASSKPPTHVPATPIAQSDTPQGSYEVAQQGPLTVTPAQETPQVAPRNARDAEIQRLENALRIGLPDAQQKYAMQRLQRLTKEQESETSFAQAGQKAEAEARAKESVKSEVATRDEANAANKQLASFARITALADKMATSKTFPYRVSVGALAKSLGISEDRVPLLGLKAGDVANAQTFNALVNESVIGKIGSGGFPANNFSDADRAFLTSTVPQLGDDPQAIKLKVKIGEAVARRSVEKQAAYVQFRKENPGKSYFDFEDNWNKDVQRMDAFGDMKKDADALVGSVEAKPSAPNLPPYRRQGGFLYKLQPDGSYKAVE